MQIRGRQLFSPRDKISKIFFHFVRKRIFFQNLFSKKEKRFFSENLFSLDRKRFFFQKSFFEKRIKIFFRKSFFKNRKKILFSKFCFRKKKRITRKYFLGLKISKNFSLFYHIRNKELCLIETKLSQMPPRNAMFWV